MYIAETYHPSVYVELHKNTYYTDNYIWMRLLIRKRYPRLQKECATIVQEKV